MMRKQLDNIFAALMLAAAIAVVLAGGWCLSHSITQTKTEMQLEPTPVAQVHIELPTQTPAPTPEPVPAYNPSIPLSPELQAVLYEACGEAGVPIALALGVIEVESCFQVDADNGKCYGLCQLNRDYFPDKLSPADNLRVGVSYLGELLERYGDTAVALTAYNAGHDTGARGYANAVLGAAGRWEACPVAQQERISQEGGWIYVSKNHQIRSRGSRQQQRVYRPVKAKPSGGSATPARGRPAQGQSKICLYSKAKKEEMSTRKPQKSSSRTYLASRRRIDELLLQCGGPAL